MNAIQNNKALFGIILSTLIYLACLHLLKSLSCITQEVNFFKETKTFLRSKTNMYTTNIDKTDRKKTKLFHPLNGIAICAIWDNLLSRLIKSNNVSIVGGKHYRWNWLSHQSCYSWSSCNFHYSWFDSNIPRKNIRIEPG